MAVTANYEAADAVTAGPLSTWLISKPDQASMTSVLILHGPCQSESASRWPEDPNSKGASGAAPLAGSCKLTGQGTPLPLHALYGVKSDLSDVASWPVQRCENV
ncbi:hypothetical protein TEQG_08205 [Trichophyton equinum CBS 127.97]|uniref:Uncharacterized protein n=1 Tax=Trichophyton equinum (strain ATCC MYA-4606 / CBS 127.97) TaxID=559882 RepID=F2Q537_TRIEC|nr:hypothetical protein TEQG_08205 [Trichophyton equinum CBS 127.97]